MNKGFFQTRGFKSAVTLCFIAVVGVIIYSNSLRGGFCSDDYLFIVHNPAIQDAGNLKHIWQVFYTRFLPGLSFALNFRFGSFDVVGYHIVNLIIHILNAFFVYYLVRLTFKTPAMKSDAAGQSADLIALSSALVFLCHPIQTQGVAYISQRISSMGAIFYLMTLVLYVQGRLTTKGGYFWGALVMMLLGLMTKEMTVTIPVALMTYEFFFFEPRGENVRKSLIRLLPFFLGIGIFLFVFFQERPDSLLGLKDQTLQHFFSWNFFITEIDVVRTYLRLLVLPVSQQHHYDYPMARGFFEGPTALSLGLVGAIFILGILQFKRSRLVSFCICWFFVTISVEVIHPCFVQKGLIYEHWLYLPMVGFSIFLSMLFYRLTMSRPRAKARGQSNGLTKKTHRFKIVMAAILLIFSILTYERNKVWGSDIVLWKDNIRKAPYDATSYFGLGFAYGWRGDLEKEMYYYRRAISLDPGYAKAYNNLGVAYEAKGDLYKAMENYRKAVEFNPNYAIGYYNLGSGYFALGDLKGAIESYRRAVAIRPNYFEAYRDLAFVYARKGDVHGSIESFRKAREIDLAAAGQVYGHLGMKYRNDKKRYGYINER